MKPSQQEQKQQQNAQGGWWGYMGSAWNSIQQTAQDFTESIRNENEETITKVKEKIDQTEIKTKLTSGVSTVGTMINDTVQKIEDKIQKEKHSSRPFWFKKNTNNKTIDSNGNTIDLEAGIDNENNEPIVPKPFEKERATYALDLESTPQHKEKFNTFLAKNIENKVDDAALCLEGRSLLSRNQAIATWFETLVPRTVDELTFWQRYFYWRYITEKREEMISRHSNPDLNNVPKNNSSSQMKSEQTSQDNLKRTGTGNGNETKNTTNENNSNTNANMSQKNKSKVKKKGGFSIIGKQHMNSSNSNTNGSKQSNTSNTSNNSNTAANTTENIVVTPTNDNVKTENEELTTIPMTDDNREIVNNNDNNNNNTSNDDVINSDNNNNNNSINNNETNNENSNNNNGNNTEYSNSNSQSDGIVGATRLADTDEDNKTNKTISSDENEQNGQFSETSWQAVNVMKSQSTEVQFNDEISPPTKVSSPDVASDNISDVVKIDSNQNEDNNKTSNNNNNNNTVDNDDDDDWGNWE